MKTQRLFQISCPGKTFLVGEYSALYGAPCLLVSTHPRFYFSVEVPTDIFSSFRFKIVPSVIGFFD